MDLHVRGMGADRPQSTTRAAQPIRLRPTSLEAPLPAPKALVPLTKPTEGPFRYEEGGFFLAGQTEVDADGSARVRGMATFQQGKVQLKGDGLFELGADEFGKTLQGSGEFVWQDEVGGSILGRGTMTVRYDYHGNTIVQLAGALRTRHRTLALDGPGEADIDVRATGAYVVRLKGRTHFGRGQTIVEGDADLTYGEVEGEPIGSIAVRGRGRAQTDGVEADGEGGYFDRHGYGPGGSLLTVTGKGTYRQGNLTCGGLMTVRIGVRAGREIVSGTISGSGAFDDGALVATGVVEGSFHHEGEQQTFAGEVRGSVKADWEGLQGTGDGILTVALRDDAARLGLALAGQCRWAAPGGACAVAAAAWSQDWEGDRQVTGEAELTIEQLTWQATVRGPVRFDWANGGVTLSLEGQGDGQVAGIVPWAGPARVNYVGGWWQVESTTSGPAVADALTLATAAPLTLEAGPLPDGRPWWRACLGQATRRLDVCVTLQDEQPVARWRVTDRAQTRDAVRPLALPEPTSP